ncbi:MAG: agmatinase [Candidatus Omnitrophica bacterium]|nr:agmatinase [Candidatus Omnitrophota bacterium]MBU1047692.1 agmatinase [Candidatus Omnitrophota bacterium]MBU1767473.1 agmatinase [Candidatus Omnitrophota bacterium]MBU1888578.1 agmatinase [Candidatus Omnitrophota bacterium]
MLKDKISNGADNFCGLAEEFSSYGKSKIVILPVPFDKTTSWLKGSDKGPEAIIEASQNMELYDIETDSQVYKMGIFTEKAVIAKDSVSMLNQTYKKVRSFLKDKKFVVTVGGEHSISMAPIKAHFEFSPDMSILHLDAHSDRRDTYEGSKYNHACVMARAREITDKIISVGIRSMDSSELKNIDRNKMFYASEIFKSKGWIRKVTNKLSKNVYVSIDLDVFDPSIMPSTGTPEPGGLNWEQVTDLLEMVSSKRNIVGTDVVELCPSTNKAPDFLAAKLIYKLLSYKFS